MFGNRRIKENELVTSFRSRPSIIDYFKKLEIIEPKLFPYVQ